MCSPLSSLDLARKKVLDFLKVVASVLFAGGHCLQCSDFREKMRRRLRNIYKNRALSNMLTSIPDGRSCTRLVSENGIEFLMRLMYPALEVDAQLQACREEAVFRPT